MGFTSIYLATLAAMPALLVSAEGEGPAVEYCATKESGGACHTEAFADGKCIALQDPEHTGIKGSSFTVSFGSDFHL